MTADRPNRRRYPRASIPVETHLRCWGDSFRGLVRVLGEGGMFIDTIHHSRDGQELEVVIDSGEPIRMRCTTRNYEPGIGMGVEFLDVGRSERSRIRDLVSKYV